MTDTTTTRAAERYRIVIEPLSEADGSGYTALAPDLPGCRSDGETPEEAMANLYDAIEEWVEEARRLGRGVPHPLG